MSAHPAHGHPQQLQQQQQQQQQQQHAPPPHPSAHPGQQYHYLSGPSPSGPPQQQAYTAYSQQGGPQPPPGQEYDEPSGGRRPSSMAGQRDPAAMQQQQHQQQQQQHQQQQQQQYQHLMRAQRPPPNANDQGPPAGYPSAPPSHPGHPAQQPQPLSQQQQQQPSGSQQSSGYPPQVANQARPSMQRSSSSNLHIQLPAQQFMAQGASQSSLATSGISPIGQQVPPLSAPSAPPIQQAPTPQAQATAAGSSRLGETSSQQFAQQQQQQQQQQAGSQGQGQQAQVHASGQRPAQFYASAPNGSVSSPTQAGAGAGRHPPGQGGRAFAGHYRLDARHVGGPNGEAMARNTEHGSLPGVASVGKGKGRARMVIEPAVSKEEEEKQFVELVYEFLYKARLFDTARSLLTETTGEPSSASSNGALPSPGSVHSSPRDLLVMGESPPANVIKRKRSHDSDSSMTNGGSGGGRVDDKDAGQLPSPVSGTGGPDASKGKDVRTKADAEGSGKGKRAGGRISGKSSGDDRSAGSRSELRKPEVEGSDRSERGLLLEWWTIFNDFRQIQTSATLAAHPPVDDAEAYLSSFGMANAHGSVPPGTIARFGVFPGSRAGSLNGGPGRAGPSGGYASRNGMDGGGPPAAAGAARYPSQPGQPARPPPGQYAGAEPYGARPGAPSLNPAAQAHYRQLVGRIEDLSVQLGYPPDRIQEMTRAPLPALASLADGLQAQLSVQLSGEAGEPSPKRVKMEGTPVPPPGGAVPKLSLQQQQQLALRQVQAGRAPGIPPQPNGQHPGPYGEEYGDQQSRAHYAAMMQRRMSQQQQQAAAAQNGQSPGGPPQMLPPAPPGYAQSPAGQPHPSQYDMSRPPSQMSYHSAYTPQAGGPPIIARTESVTDHHSDYAATPRMHPTAFEAASPSVAKVPSKAAPAAKTKAKAAPKKSKAKPKPPTSPAPPSPAPPAPPPSTSNHDSPQVTQTASTPANTSSPHPAMQPSPAGVVGSPLPPPSAAPTPQAGPQYLQDQGAHQMQQQVQLQQQLAPPPMHEQIQQHPAEQQHQQQQQQQQQQVMMQRQMQPPPQPDQMQQQQQQPPVPAAGGANGSNLLDASLFTQAGGDGGGGDYPFASVDMNDPSLMAMFANTSGDAMLDLDAELGTDFDFSSWMVDESHEPPPA